MRFVKKSMAIAGKDKGK